MVSPKTDRTRPINIFILKKLLVFYNKFPIPKRILQLAKQSHVEHNTRQTNIYKHACTQSTLFF